LLPAGFVPGCDAKVSPALSQPLPPGARFRSGAPVDPEGTTPRILLEGVAAEHRLPDRPEAYVLRDFKTCQEF
jgi:hypothetical protein